MRRSLAAGVAAFSAGCLLSGCGSGGKTRTLNTSTPSHAGAATTAGSAAGEQISVGRARALAKHINLLAADVPGFKPSREGEHEHETGAEQRWEREMLRCAGAQRFPEHGLVEASSAKLERERGIDSSSVQSKVTLAMSAALAQQELAALKSSRGASCMGRFLGLLLKSKTPPGATVGRVRVSQGVPPGQGTSGSFALRISTALDARGVRVPVYFDLLGFAAGPLEVVLQTSGVPSPFPAALEEHLYLLLLERTKAHAS